MFKIDRFTIFVLLFCCASLIHHLLQAYVWFPQVSGQLYILAVIAALLNPNILYCFYFLMAIAATKLFLSVPWLPNHLVFETLVLLSICAVVIFSLLNHKKVPVDQRSLMARMAPLVRSYLVIMYFFTFLAKLNWDFLDPQYSCGVVMLKDIVRNYSWINWGFLGSWGEGASIWGTIIVEFLLPVLLIVPRARHWGVVLGLFFHFMMGSILQEPICSFSGMSFVFLLFFMDDAAIGKMGEILGQLRRPIKEVPLIRFVCKSCLGVLIYGVLYLKYKGILGPQFTYAVWYLFTAVVAALYLRSIYLAHREKRPGGLDQRPSLKETFLPKPWYLIFLTLPLLINGISPYLGLKTQGSLTMFSNLRIFGNKPNHLIFPSSIKLHEEELIKVLDSDHPPLKEFVGKPYLLPLFEFRHWVSQMPDGRFVTYVRKGQTQSLRRGAGEPYNDELFKPITWIQRKLIRFKSEDEREHTYCTW